jgi:flagellar protein FliL
VTVTAMPTTDEAEDQGKKKGGKKKLLIIALVVILLGGGGYYWFFMKSSGPAKPKPGAVLALDEQTVNLAGGHYLKVKLALQLTTKAGEEFDGSEAMQEVIDVMSGRDVGEVNLAKTRQSLQKELTTRIETDYPGEVMEVFLTEFVTT